MAADDDDALCWRIGECERTAVGERIAYAATVAKDKKGRSEQQSEVKRFVCFELLLLLA